MSTNAQAKHGLKWSMIYQVFNQVFTFGVGIVLARLILPKEYGLLGMVNVFVGFAISFQRFGISHALISKKQSTNDDYSTAFWFSVFLGTTIGALIFCLAKPIATFYNEPVLIKITKIVALSFIINALSSIHLTIIREQIKFKLKAIIDIIVRIIKASFTIVLAYYGHGVWALVWGNILGFSLTTIGYWMCINWHPSFKFSKHSFKYLLRFGGAVAGDNTLNYWSKNAINLLIGKTFGSTGLGLYERASQLMLLPITQIAQSIRPVLLPALVKLNDDKEIQKAYLKLTNYVTFLSFPLMFCLSAVASPLVLGLYGSNWHGVIPLLQVLAFRGAMISFGTYSGELFLVKQKPGKAFRIKIVMETSQFLFIVLAFLYGNIITVALFYTIYAIVFGWITIYFAVALIKLKVKSLLNTLKFNFINASVCAGILLLVQKIQALNNLAPLYSLFVLFCIGIVTYSILTFLFNKPMYMVVVKSIKARSIQ